MANAVLQVVFSGTQATGLNTIQFASLHTANLTGITPGFNAFFPHYETYANVLTTAQNFRSAFLQYHGPTGSINQINCTVSALTSPSTGVYAFNIEMNEPLYGDITIDASASGVTYNITQEDPVLDFTAYVSEVVETIEGKQGDFDKCGNAGFIVSQLNGVGPNYSVIDSAGNILATGLSFNYSRNNPNRNLKLVDSNNNEAIFVAPYVRSYSISQIQQNPQPAGTNISIILSSDGLGSSFPNEYSLDGITYQASSSFSLVAPGSRTIYVSDPYGCVKTQALIVDAFQFQKIIAVHNTLNFELSEPESGAPEYMDVRLLVNEVPVGDYKAHPYQRDNGNIIYLFNADEVIRQYMPPIDDYGSLLNATEQASNMQAQIKLQKKRPTITNFAQFDIFIAVNAARQIGGAGEDLTALVNNQENTFVFVEGQPGYIYFYDNQFYRQKKLLTQSTNITINGITKFIEVIPYCAGDVVLKYLDKNGMYRFYKFSRFYARNVRGELIGSVEKLFTSLSSGQGFKKNIGYNAQEELTVKANAVPASHMESLQDVYTSARVYMHIGNHGEDALKDWVLVDVEGDGLIKHNKRQFNDIELTIKPPKRNNVTML